VFVTVMVNGALVVAVRWFPKAAGDGEKLNAGVAGVTPVPVRATLSGLVEALVAKVRFAFLAVAVVGENTTLIEQDARAARVELQVLPLVENSAALAPVSVMLAIVKVAFPGLVSVTRRLPLEVPVAWLPNAMLVGLSET